MEGKFGRIFFEWYEKQKYIDSSNRLERLIDIVSLLKSKGYDDDRIMHFGPEICQELTDKTLPEAFHNCQELIIAYELKKIIGLVNRAVEPEQDVIGEEKEPIEIIETEKEKQIDINLKDLNLQIESDTSFLDSLRVKDDE